MSRKLNKLNLKPSTLERLEKLNLHTCKDVLNFTELELMNFLGISKANVSKLMKVVCQACAPCPITAYDVYEMKKVSPNNGFFPTSLSSLDDVLQGGFLIGSITEIVGPPSVGKTQFSILLSILATLPLSVGGLDGGVLYIDTELAFTGQRLKEMAESRFPELYDSEVKLIQLMESVFVYQPTTLKGLKKIVEQIEQIVISKNVKLIIIDSIATLLRKELGMDEVISISDRTNILIEHAAILKDLAERYKVVVFLTNQITTNVPDMMQSCPETDEVNVSPSVSKNNNISSLNQVPASSQMQKSINGDQVIPALGAAWAHCVNTRLIARFVSPTVRQLIIAKSPLSPNASVQYIITQAGIKLLNNVERMNCFDSTSFQIFTRCDFLSDDQ